MATGVLDGMVFVGMVGRSTIPIGHKTEGAGQTFKIGEPLIYSSGRLVIAGSDPNATIEGIALANATGVTGSDVPFIELVEGLEFEMSFMGAAAADYVLAQTDIGVAYGIAVSSNKWYLDQSETSVAQFRVDRPRYPFVIGDTNARVIVKTITAKYLP